MDGIDIDWEFPQEEEWDSFSLLLVQLKQLLSSQPQPIALSVALYPQQNQLNTEAMQALDRIHLMAYDQFDQQGFHSTLQTAQEAVEPAFAAGSRCTSAFFRNPRLRQTAGCFCTVGLLQGHPAGYFPGKSRPGWGNLL